MAVSALSYSDSDGPHTVVLDRVSTSIGRSPAQDVVLREPAVSRRHAVIERDGDNYTVVDQKSTHGTFLNGVRVERAELKPGDQLQMGSLHGPKLRFHSPRADQAPVSAGHSTFGDLISSMEGFRLPADQDHPATREIEQLNWLLRAARQLNEGGAIEDILGVLLQLTLQLTGVERGFVFLFEDGEMRFAQGLGPEGKIAREDSTISHRAMQRAIDSEMKFSVSDTLSDQRTSEWSSVMANKIRSIYCIPLRKRITPNEPVHLIGLLYLDSQIRPGSLSEVDHQLLDTIATEASALLHNALLAEAESKARQAREELAIAARIHSSLMSAALPALPYAELQAKTIPCLAIGGDFYDVVVLDDCVCVTVVDVSGKGVSAAIVAATLQGILHAQLLAGQSFEEIAVMVNQFLCARNVGKYATMIALRLFPDGRIEYLNCGHILPVSIMGAGVRLLEAGNLIVGLIAGASYSSAFDRLQPGERLLLATDGITEAENKDGELFGYDGLSDAAHRHREIDAILDRVGKFHAPQPAQDDCTLVEVRYTGQP
ncbi:MAG: SpoIIE family protein phosphatase [Terracidiphilus sp.]|jgi:serine phosphatase RsbU (regulator of sigma subunit)